MQYNFSFTVKDENLFGEFRKDFFINGKKSRGMDTSKRYKRKHKHKGKGWD